MKKNLLAAGIALCCLATNAHAQDIHFSQFYETSILRNPALTGILTNDYKVVFNYRSQWSSLGRPFQTGVVSAEGRFAVGRDRVDYFSVGLLGYYDKAGTVALKTTAVYPAVNFNKSLGGEHNTYLSVGFTGGYVQRSYDEGALTFDNEYQNGNVNLGAGAGEDLPASHIQHWDLGTGVTFNSGLGNDNNITYIIGASAYHFTRPRSSFTGGDSVVNLQTRWNGSLSVDCKMNDVWSLQVHTNYAQQGAYREVIGGALIRYGRTNDVNQHIYTISAGCFYRLNDAVIPTMRIEYKQLGVGVSYDVNVSSLKTVTNMNGGMEITAYITGMFNGMYDDKHSCPRF